jgi:hypothetical protein
LLCAQGGLRPDSFGHDGARHEAERLKVPFLVEVPLHMAAKYRERGFWRTMHDLLIDNTTERVASKIVLDA